MIFEKEEYTLSDGRKCIVRPVAPEDAQTMLEYLKITAGETDYLARYSDEVTYTMEQEQTIIAGKISNPREVFMLVEVDGHFAGNCSVNQVSPKRKFVHRASFGIALYKEFWGLGIGSILIKRAISFAKELGYKQLELEVVSENRRAISLYEKNGFVKYGECPRSMRLDDGRYLSEHLMCLDLEGNNV